MEELIKLAEEKGFKSRFLSHKAYKYSTKEELRKLFLLVEIQKWLREEHDVHANAEKMFYGQYCSILQYKCTNMPMYYRVSDRWSDMGDVTADIQKSTYEESLQRSIKKALQMVGGKTV